MGSLKSTGFQPYINEMWFKECKYRNARRLLETEKAAQALAIGTDEQIAVLYDYILRACPDGIKKQINLIVRNVDLESSTFLKLREIARSIHVTNYSHMTKDQLVRGIRKQRHKLEKYNAEKEEAASDSDAV